jgi:hypothetical protein
MGVLETLLRYCKAPDLLCSFKAGHRRVSVRGVMVHQFQVLHPFSGIGF